MVYNIIFAFVFTMFLMDKSFAENFTRSCLDLSSQCLTESIQLAIPSFINGSDELGLERLDPYFIEKLDLTLPGGITINFSRGVAKGLKKCIVDFARFSGNELETQFRCNLTIKGHYKSSGRMLMFSIDGEGQSVIRCNNLKIHSVLKLGSVVHSDGKKYLDIKDMNISHSYDGRVTYSMTNLFKRNPEIHDAVLDFMNSNWRMVAEEFGDPMVEFGVKCVMRNIKQLIDVVPMEKFTNTPVNL